MYIFLIAIGLFLLIFTVFNFLRKLHWDAIQNNLLELIDDIGGQVIRRGILGRPIYHGSIDDIDLTINFSTEKSDRSRRNFIDISMGRKLSRSFTIASMDWLREQNEGDVSDYEVVMREEDTEYGIRTGDNSEPISTSEKENLIKSLNKLTPFRFLYVSPNGLLFEKPAADLPKSTRYPGLKKDIESLAEIVKLVK